jgi:hypothetical protein
LLLIRDPRALAEKDRSAGPIKSDLGLISQLGAGPYGRDLRRTCIRSASGNNE